ncbi:MAG: PBP1A family penicillin-binding protein [Chloroflexota bacterium]|nr:PBP1A family penicillin-binding protein [Chloroflexota bacterium]
MSHGRIARVSRLHPDAQRRAMRYGHTLRGRRPNGLPPHLLPGVSGRGARKGIGRGRILLIAANVVMAAFLLATAAFVVSSVAAVGGTVAAYRQVNEGLPNATGIVIDTFQSSRIMDRNGKLLQEIDDPDIGWRSFVPLDQISPDLINATIAAEDATFWTHRGVEPLAIVRGAVINVSSSGSSGGSTITQQLVRSLFPTEIGNEISYTRKAKEALASVELERRYSKQDILTMYLNQIFYGSRSYGVEAASQTFFNKNAKDLTLGEAAMLAGLPQRPTDYNPAIKENFELAKQRQRYVLNQMVKYGYITRAEANAAWTDGPIIESRRTGAVLDNPHFVNYVRDYIVEKYGEDALFQGGLQITTTIDSDLQDFAEQTVAAQVEALAPYNAQNAAAVVMLPWSGEILAMVGSANFDNPLINGQVNVTTSDQQPGSAIKPIAYAAAFEDGWSPGTVLLDAGRRWPTPGAPDPYYEPQNYTGNFYGAVTVRTALANSLNLPAVKATDYTGVDSMINLAQRMGMKKSLLRDPSFYGISIALGGGEVLPLDLTNAYATFANQGRYVPANPILKIEDSQGNVLYDIDRKTVFQRGQQVLKAEYAYQITSILTDNKARSLIFTEQNLFGQTQSQLGRPTAAKSGTTNGWVDIWTMGYTTDLAVGVWVGNTDNDPLREIDGIEGAGPIWNKIMVEMHQNPKYQQLLLGPDGKPLPETFARPQGIYEGQLCAATGQRPVGREQTRTDLLVRGEGPALRCDQINAWQREDLELALEDVNRNGGKYVGDAVGMIRRYADAAQYRSGGTRFSEPRLPDSGPPG